MTKVLILSLTLSAWGFLGCASQNTADVVSESSKQILDITIDENPESVVFSIKGNQRLTYSSAKQSDPTGILFYFPDTRSDTIAGRFQPPENEIIRFFTIDHFVEEEATTAVIFIALKHETSYDVIPENNLLQVQFSKRAGLSENRKPPQEAAQNRPQPKPAQRVKPRPLPVAQKSAPTPRLLKTVTTNTLENTLTVLVEADGPIDNVKNFRLVNPDRIVFDLYHVKSPYQKQQIIDISSDWVWRIRYYGHPEKLRLVIETSKAFSRKFLALPTDTGLIIEIKR